MPPARKAGRKTATATRPEDRIIQPREEGAIATIEAHDIDADDIVPEGDFAGMTYNEVLDICKSQAEEALGQMSIEGAGAVVDMLMEEVLQVTMHYKGKVAAKEAGIRYCQTAMKYAMLDVSKEPDRVRSLSEAIEELRRKRGR